jgi:hypothetical protein
MAFSPFIVSAHDATAALYDGHLHARDLLDLAQQPGC